MKKSFTMLLLSASLMLCACGNNNASDINSDNSPLASDPVESTNYEDQSTSSDIDYSYYEDAINYYENLCDEYGYQTYESVYCPELWCNYFPPDSSIYHNDWLCPEFDNSGNYYVSANPDFYEEHYGNKLCDICGNTEIYYLDVDQGIFHSQKTNLTLGTDDFITCYVNYRFVSEARAIENGFSPCECCIF